MVGWNKQVLTQAQKDTATKLFAEWRETQQKKKKTGDGWWMGQVPYCIVDADGDVVMADQGAACLSSLYHTNMGTNNPVLFQMVMLKEDQRNVPYASDEDTLRYVDWACHSSFLQRYILKHTKAERLQFGVPIALMGVPRNLPLLASTHIRYMWDGHNSKFTSNIPRIRKMFPRLTWAEVFVLSVCLSDITGHNIQLRLTSDAHSAFGSSSKMEAIKDYARQKFDHQKMDKIKLDTTLPSRGLGIECMFSKYCDGEQFNSVVVRNVKEQFPNVARWGDYAFEKKHLKKVVSIILKELR